MNLIDENIEKESEEKQKKIIKMIIIAIVVLIAIVLVVLGYSAIKKKNTLTLSIDNESKQFKSEMFIMADKKNLYTSDNGEIYISVRELANMLGVGYFNDEYKGKGEDTTKCYIKTDNEYTSFISGSSQIYKVRDNKSVNEEQQKSSNQNSKIKDEIQPNDYEYEYFEINDGVRYVNNEIYASKTAIELGFNVNVFYDKGNKAVKIYTLDGLQKMAVDKVKGAAVTENLDYYNKKLLKYGLVLIKNANDDYGIANYINYQEGNYVLSCKYSKIKFIESLGCIIVTTSESKEQGILKIDLYGNDSVKTVVDPKYQEINQLTEDGQLYVIKEGGKYGILKVEEQDNEIKTENILKSEYQTIGIDNYSEFEEMSSKYLINGKYIPIKRDDKWGIVTRNGAIAVMPQYDTVGCIASDSGKSVACVPELKNGSDAIVFGIKNAEGTQNNNNQQTSDYKYMLYIIDTKERVGYDALEIYSTYENNERSYYMKVQAVDGSTHRINIYQAYGVKKIDNNKNTNNDQTNNTTNTVNNSSQTNTTNTSSQTTNTVNTTNTVQ